MFSYIFSFLSNERNDNNKPNKFCYIIGSFASTAPNLRTPKSDVDILCSTNIDEFQIRHYLKQKYPNLPANIPLDIKYVKAENGSADYPICYWQNPKYIPIIDNQNIKPRGVPGIIDLPSVARNPDKNELVRYLNQCKQIDLTHPIHFANSVRNHYGENDFLRALNHTNLGYQEKHILAGLSNNNLSGHKFFSINRENNLVTGSVGTHNYFDFFKNVLGYNYFYASFYSSNILRRMDQSLKNLKQKYLGQYIHNYFIV